MTPPVPVALFAYRRPDLLARTLDALRANGVPLIHAFSDGPREPADAPAVTAVRALLKDVRWADVVLTAREGNFGLGTSVVQGVTQVLREHDAVIVCEDDLFVVPGAYAYLVAALARYRDDARVMSVSAWTHTRVTPLDVGDQPYFSGRANTLFWGTWARAWHGMDSGSAEARLARFAARGGDPGCYGDDLWLQARAEKSRNLWAVRFIAEHLATGGLSLCPPWTMVEHVGNDERASNAVSDPTWDERANRAAPAVPARWPEPRLHPRIAALWRAAVEVELARGRTPSPVTRAVRKLRRMWTRGTR